MFADGYITEGANGQFIFGISLAEEEPLVLFKKYLNTEKPITTSISSGFSNSKIYSLEISSKKVFKDLVNKGVVKNKTFNLKFPRLDDELIPHFIRGFFDGDGTVFTGQQKDKLYLYSGFSGIESFLKSILNKFPFITSDYENLYKDNRKKSDCWNIKFSTKKSILLYKYLYKDCDDLFLKRKKDKFENYMKDEGSTTIITNPTNNKEG